MACRPDGWLNHGRSVAMGLLLVRADAMQVTHGIAPPYRSPDDLFLGQPAVLVGISILYHVTSRRREIAILFPQRW